MKICKYICLFSLYFLYVIVFFALCFLLNVPLVVLKVFFLLLCIFLLFVYFWGDWIILVMIKARKLSQTQIEGHELYKNEVENVACLMGLVGVEVYRAKNLPLDIYVLKGSGNGSRVILGGGRNDFGHLSQKEINALIYFSILKIKKLNLRFIQVCNFFFFIINLPTIFVKKFTLLKFIGLIMDFFLLPLKTFKEVAFKEDIQHLEKFVKKLEIDDRGSLIQATLFKLKYLSFKYSGGAERLLLTDLAMVKREL